jgi:hypothetical protein
MIKFIAPPSPETRDFDGRTRADVAVLPTRRARAIAEAILTAEQKAALASYDAPRYTQGAVPCCNPKRGAR